MVANWKIFDFAKITLGETYSMQGGETNFKKELSKKFRDFPLTFTYWFFIDKVISNVSVKTQCSVLWNFWNELGLAPKAFSTCLKPC